MFHFLSKVLSFLTVPFVLIVAFFVTSALIKSEKRKKMFFRIGLGLLLFFSNGFVANQAMRAWEIEPVRYNSLKAHYKFGIVLSGFSSAHADYDDRVFLKIDRLTHAVYLYKSGILEKFLISGGQGGLTKKRLLEAEQISQILEIMGVNQKDIIKESGSRNTHESAVEVSKIIKSTDASDCLLITSASHMRRAKACFDKVGLSTIQPFSTDLLSSPSELSSELFIPNTDALWFWKIIFKEALGCLVYRAMGYI